MIEILFLIFPLSLLFFLLVFAIWLAGVWWQALRVTLKAFSRFHLRTLFLWTTIIAVFLTLFKHRQWLPGDLRDPLVLVAACAATIIAVVLGILVVKDYRNDRICVSHDLQQRLARARGANAPTWSSRKRPRLRLRSRQLRFWRPGGRIDV